MVSEAQINQWKIRWKEIYQIEIPTEEQLYVDYVRKPDLDVLSAASRFSETDPIKAGNIMFENCFLGGDEAIKENDELKLSVIQAISKLVKIREAQIKKL